MTNLDALWVLPEELDEELNPANIDPDDEQALRDYEVALEACKFASDMLWRLSGRKFHTGAVATEQYVVDRSWLGPHTLTPIRGQAVYDRNWGVYIVDPYDWNSRKIRLDGTPVRSIASVSSLADGSVIDPGQYSVINRAFLRLDTVVPRGIDVSYSYGTPPPTSGRMAARTMALQFFYLWSGREDLCQLPSRVTSVSRENVNWTILDNQDFLDEMKTGIYAVDMFLRSVNPDKARTKAKVFSVDLPRGRRRSL